MASPQESITTVSGRRCTRSRARTAATSTSILTTSEPAVVAPSEVTTSTSTTAAAPAVQTSAVAEAPPPAPPASSAAPPSSAPAEQPAAAPTTTQAAVSSAIGTISSVPISSAVATPTADTVPSQQAAAAPQQQVQASRPAAAAIVSQVAEASTPIPTVSAIPTVPIPVSEAPATTSSDTIPTAALPASPNQSSLPLPSILPPGTAESAVLPSTLAVDTNQPTQPGSPSETASTANGLPAGQSPAKTTAAPTGDAAAGLIGPERGSGGDDGGLTIPNGGDSNIGGIVGGVIGGVAGFALICALLFYCLRKRKSKQPGWSEKNLEGPRFMDKMKAKAAGVGVMFAKVKGLKKGPARNPYQRHSQQDSVSSIYSTTDGQGFYAAGDMKRSSSRKSERNRLRKKNSSVSSQSTFTGIMEETENSRNNPFADPEPPRILRLSNPDTASPRGPLTPQPALTSARATQDPFASAFDNHPDLMLPPPGGHQRTQSSASALSSHPPSFIFPAPSRPTRSKSITKASLGPPPPTQAPGPSHNRRSSMALPTFDSTSSGASGESDLTYYGEPGPSRPATGMFTPMITPGLPTGRTVRQSDPFDLDRPEVLRFGNVLGRNEVRSSVTRQPSNGRRTSTAGGWASVKDAAAGPFSWNVIPRR
jgi:hypothetical protein